MSGCMQMYQTMLQSLPTQSFVSTLRHLDIKTCALSNEKLVWYSSCQSVLSPRSR